MHNMILPSKQGVFKAIRLTAASLLVVLWAGWECGSALSWTDENIDANTRIKAVHYQEIKDKINELRSAGLCNTGSASLPADFESGQPVTASDTILLRNAILEIYENKGILQTVSDPNIRTILDRYNVNAVNAQQLAGTTINRSDMTDLRALLNFLQAHPGCGAGPVCGNGIVQAGEQCDEGVANGVYPSAYCSAACTINEHFQKCGNGIIDPGEQCDTENGWGNGPCQAGYGCSEHCMTNNLGNCGTGVCGDGVVDPGEECDDFYDRGAGSNCRADCKWDNNPVACPDGHWTVSHFHHVGTGFPCFEKQFGGGGASGLQEATGCCTKQDWAAVGWRWWTPDAIDCCCPSDGAGGYTACGCETIRVRKYYQFCL